MDLSLKNRFEDFSIQSLMVKGEQTKKALDEAVDRYFYILLEQAIGRNAAPSYTGARQQWRPLSEKWTDQKTISGHSNPSAFYSGVTDLGKDNRAPSFESYIRSLADSRMASRIFGSTQSRIMLRGAEVRVRTITPKNNRRSYNQYWSPLTGKAVAAPTASDQLRLEITAFPKLEGAAMTEQGVATRIYQESDGQPGALTQLYKVVGGHPLRRIYLPLINWYLRTELKNVMRRLTK